MKKTTLSIILVIFGFCHYSFAADTEKSTENEKTDKVTVQLPRADPPLFLHFSDTCGISATGSRESPFALLLLGTILKPIIETAVPAATGWLYDKGTQALEKHNAKQTSSSTTSTTTVFYNVSDKKFQFGCIILARAKRGTGIDIDNYSKRERGGSFSIASTSVWQINDKDPNGKPVINKNTEERLRLLGISRAPEFYMELAFGPVKSVIEEDSDIIKLLPENQIKKKPGTEVKPVLKEKTRSMYRTVTPAYLTYFASGAEDVKDGKKHVSVEIHMDAMDTKGEWQPFYSKTYDLGKLTVGSENINLASLGTDTFAPPPLRITTDGYRDPVPVRVTAVLTETDDNIDLSRILETAFKDEQTKKSTVDAVAKAVVEKLQSKIDEKTGSQPAANRK